MHEVTATADKKKSCKSLLNPCFRNTVVVIIITIATTLKHKIKNIFHSHFFPPFIIPLLHCTSTSIHSWECKTMDG
jgi:hypothetical protein